MGEATGFGATPHRFPAWAACVRGLEVEEAGGLAGLRVRGPDTQPRLAWMGEEIVSDLGEGTGMDGRSRKDLEPSRVK